MKYAIGRPFAPNSSTLGGDFAIPSSISGPATGGGAGQVISGWPYDNIRDEHIQRSCRTNSGANAAFTFTVSSQVVSAVFVEGLNTSQITVTSGGGHSSGTLTCAMNPRTGRYSRYYEPTSGASTTWTVTLLNAGKIDSSHNYLEVGRICMVKSGSLNTMLSTSCWGQPFNVSVDSGGEERLLSSGEVETNSMSDKFIRLDLQGLFKIADSSITAHPYAFARMSRDERVLLFENRPTDTNKVFTHLLRRAGESSIVEEYPSLDVSVPMQEVI